MSITPRHASITPSDTSGNASVSESVGMGMRLFQGRKGGGLRPFRPSPTGARVYSGFSDGRHASNWESVNGPCVRFRPWHTSISAGACVLFRSRRRCARIRSGPRRSAFVRGAWQPHPAGAHQREELLIRFEFFHSQGSELDGRDSSAGHGSSSTSGAIQCGVNSATAIRRFVMTTRSPVCAMGMYSPSRRLSSRVPTVFTASL